MKREMLINSIEFNSSDTPPFNFAVGAGLSKSTVSVITRAIQTMTINQNAELKQKFATFSNPANQMSCTGQWNLNLFVVMLTRLRGVA